MAKTKQLETTNLQQVARVAEGAIAAFGHNLLHEFSSSGGDGVIEIRFVGGVPQGVYVRAIGAEEKAVPRNVRGSIANWAMTLDQLAQLFIKSQEA